MLRVMGLCVIIYSLSRIPAALLDRGLRFGRKVLPEVMASLGYTLVSILMAYMQYGYWSIVGGTVARSALLGVGLFLAAGWRPGLLFDLSVAQELIAYARVLMASSVLRLLYTNVDNAIVGKVAGVTALGYYAMAYNLANLTALQVAGPVGSVLFPTYSRMLPDLDRVRRANLLTLRYLSILASPIMGFGLVASPYLVDLVLGQKWEQMTPALEVLLVYGWLRTMAPAYSALMLATDLNRIPFRINITTLLLGALGAPLIAFQFGFVGVAVEFTLLEALRLAWVMAAARSHLQQPLTSQLSAIAPGLLGALLGSALLAALTVTQPPRTLLIVVLELAAAAAVYGTYLVLRGELNQEHMARLREVVARRARPG
jgi:O-antigen/teichoic acid export membrane protein